MPSVCEASDTRTADVGGCILSVRIESRCEQITVADLTPPTAGIRPIIDALHVPAQPIFWRVTYTISNDGKSLASVSEFRVDGEIFTFPNPIDAGGEKSVVIVRERCTDCEKKKAGIIKAEGAGGGGMTLDKFEVCVLR